MLTLRVGNTHTFDSSSQSRRPHHWLLYVDLVDLVLSDAAGCAPEDVRLIGGVLSESLVERVVFHHASLRPKRIHVVESTVCEPDGRRRFGIERTERWAYSNFEIGITVHFRGDGRLALKHVLQFDGDGSGDVQDHQVPIRPELLEAAARQEAAEEEEEEEAQEWLPAARSLPAPRSRPRSTRGSRPSASRGGAGGAAAARQSRQRPPRPASAAAGSTRRASMALTPPPFATNGRDSRRMPARAVV